MWPPPQTILPPPPPPTRIKISDPLPPAKTFLKFLTLLPPQAGGRGRGWMPWKGQQCYMKLLKWFVRSCIALLNKMLFLELAISKMFILAPCCNLTMMMESILSFLLSYFSTIFLAKGKISKRVSLFLSHIGPKWCLPMRLQDFKSNISLEQSNEIVYFFTCWYQKVRVHRKILGWVWSEMVVATLVTRWVDEWKDELCWFFMLIKLQEC